MTNEVVRSVEAEQSQDHVENGLTSDAAKEREEVDEYVFENQW